MPRFGKSSKENREFLCKDLKRLVDEVIKYYDFSIICGHRDRTEQEKAYKNGTSKAHFGQSAHNYNPSFAFDFTPYPCPTKQVKGTIQIDSDSPEWQKAVCIFKNEANKQGIEITCGADFKTLKDLMHIEIKNWRTRIKNI